MRVLLFFDQTQAGAGGKERPDVKLAVEKGGIGSYHMFEGNLKEIEATVLATMYCGNGYFFNHEEEVKRKVVGLVKKLKADIVICGPCFDYRDYSEMSAILAQEIENQTESKAIVMCSKENNDVITKYKDDVSIVRMPKKGGTGLRDSFSNMAKVILAKSNNEPIKNYSLFIY
ncbi:GrdB-related putative oxidoreductase [Aerococcus urinaeequi]|uniref:Glycine/sarcosine/betaine reductase selenoprotein B family protein n=1 Tax=Aerococcus urinaeequi TaxID=51665 RepID=A0AA47J2T7_9LACT|nr:GrdB-related putative oxidoreductase [Aerococcus urinaeequi]WAT24670.1 glycine/sarcosine/betaine reductase selenoprotein B family protein [Aerococcus urinaeequi]